MLKCILKFVCKTMFKVEVKGLDNVPVSSNVLVTANHESFLDGLLLGLFLPINATFVVHTTVLKNFFFRCILKLVPHLAVDPTSPMAMKKVIKLLEAGKSVVIFPEGRITRTGSLMKVYDGPGFVAAKSKVNILPIKIDGAARSYFSRLTGSHPKRILPKVTIYIQPTTSIQMSDAPDSKRRRKDAGESMRRVMQNTLFESQPTNTLFSAFLSAMEIHGKSTRFVEDMQQTEESFGDLLKKSMALGRLVSKLSSKSENVGVMLPNVTSTVCLVFGMSAMGRVPAMLNYTSGSAGIYNACVAANVKTVITSKKFIESAKLDGVVAGIDSSIKFVYLEDLRKEFTLTDKLWLVLFATKFPKLAAEPATENDPAVVLFTSGSEGKPKGVVHSHKGILSNIAQIRSVIDFSPDDKFMIALPLFHAFGFTCGAVMPLVSGCKLFLYPSPLHYKVIPEVIYDRGCTVLFGTSTFLGNYAKYAHPYDFYKLRYVVAGAEKLNEEVRKAWVDKFGIRILEGYGSTECAPVISVNTPMAYKAGSVGAALPGMESRLEIVSGIDNGGLLHVKGPNIMKGYYLFDNPGVLVPPVDGWYSTGDIVEIDRDNFITIKGRVKRFAKVAGEMVSLETVEKIANIAAPSFQHAASTVADAQKGEAIILFTTCAELSRSDLQIAAKNLGAPELAIAKKIVLLKEIPLLGTGKTDYVSLKAMAEAQ